MRVKMLSGTKRVTVVGPAHTGHVVVRERHARSATEKLKFVVISPSGQVQRGELRLDLGSIKKDSRRLRPIERGLRRLVRAEYKALGRYLVLHERSRRKRRNGWARDLRSNLIKVVRHES
jgi:hypothetical protein